MKKTKHKGRATARPTKRLPPAPKPTPESSQEAPVTATKGKKTDTKRPPAPKSFSFEKGQILVGTWDDEGARAGAARVEDMRYVWSEEQERWLEQLELSMFRAVGFGTAMTVSKSNVKILGTHGHWMGPRETSYELREPSGKEQVTITNIVNCAVATAVQRRTTTASGQPRIRKPKGDPGATTLQVIAMMKRPKGATIAEIMEVTGWQPHSTRGFFSGVLKRKMGLTVTSIKKEGKERTYIVEEGK